MTDEKDALHEREKAKLDAALQEIKEGAALMIEAFKEMTPDDQRIHAPALKAAFEDIRELAKKIERG
jgi:hypothetical protein